MVLNPVFIGFGDDFCGFWRCLLGRFVAPLWLFSSFRGFSVLSGRTKAISFSQETSGAHQIAQGEDGITHCTSFFFSPR
jgi:hypothetical protein